MLEIALHQQYVVQDFSGNGTICVPNVKSITGMKNEIAPILQYLNCNHDTTSFFYTVLVKGNMQVEAKIELSFFGQEIINLNLDEFAQKLNITKGNYVIR
ncbi:hypothetical protein [Proteus mirabilis]|uniref:hypothetical protein n=1 Tax=Proteus mirabilis TaxID=584 RepID=UPI00217DC166|nr:hypothetical protein [Proteus mirabilis]MCS6725434.1 hypothetical protein [Proteus mirabilis]